MVRLIDHPRAARQDGVVTGPDLGRLLLESHRTLVAELVASLEERGYPDVRAAHLGVFQHVDRRHGTRLTELAHKARMTKQGRLLLVDDLEPSGLRAPRGGSGGRQGQDREADRARAPGRAEARRAVPALETRTKRQLGDRRYDTLREVLEVIAFGEEEPSAAPFPSRNATLSRRWSSEAPCPRKPKARPASPAPRARSPGVRAICWGGPWTGMPRTSSRWRISTRSAWRRTTSSGVSTCGPAGSSRPTRRGRRRGSRPAARRTRSSSRGSRRWAPGTCISCAATLMGRSRSCGGRRAGGALPERPSRDRDRGPARQARGRRLRGGARRHGPGPRCGLRPSRHLGRSRSHLGRSVGGALVRRVAFLPGSLQSARGLTENRGTSHCEEPT